MEKTDSFENVFKLFSIFISSEIYLKSILKHIFFIKQVLKDWDSFVVNNNNDFS